MNSYHDWQSPVYSRQWMERWDSRPSRDEQFETVASLLPFAPDDRFTLVDVGAGFGALAGFLLKRFPKAQAILVDFAPAMLDLARQQLAGCGKRVRFEVGDLSRGDCFAALRGSEVAAAVSSIAIHNLEDAALIQGAYRQVCDLLGPSGRFVNIDHVASVVPGGREHHFQGSMLDHLAWLQAAGFRWADVPWRKGHMAIMAAGK